MACIVLKTGREQSLRRHHPWVFSGAVRRVEDAPRSGETVHIFAAEGEWLATGSYSPASQIPARVWTFDREEKVTPEFVAERLEQAMALRRPLAESDEITAYRLVYSESDGLPGVIVDRYADFLVCQFLTAGAESWKHRVVAMLRRLVPCRGIYERSDADVRGLEGLEPTVGVLAGDEPPDLVEIREGPARFWVDLKHGQKTGFYLDQRDNRMLLAECAEGAHVLNAFAYTGAFGVWALLGGASRVVNLDSSRSALQLAEKNASLNGFGEPQVSSQEDDVFRALRKFRDARISFDVIVLDPPKFAHAQSHLVRACRGYKDINLLALKLLRPGGTLFTVSCSGIVTPDLVQKIVAGAALDSGRRAQIVQWLSQSLDHPVALNFPEAHYLKGLAVRAL